MSSDSEVSSESGLREEVLAWLADNWEPEMLAEDWWSIAAKDGWTAPHLAPEQGGRGLPRSAVRTVRAVFAEFGALMPPGGLGLLMAAPTILTHGTPDQISRLVPPILEGRVNWCQLFSEPGAGSDLAGLTTRAERDGDRWIIRGQKVWSSMARTSDYGMLLARTNFAVPKHRGISWFAFPLDQPGVNIRPLREMTGDAVFNEVFLDDAEVSNADLIGGVGQGWTVTQTTLHFERTGIGAGGGHVGFPEPGPKGGMFGRKAGDAALTPPPGGGGLTLTVGDLMDLLRATGKGGDPVLRQRMALLYAYSKVGQWNAQRARDEAASGGGHGVANLGKIAQTRIVKQAASLAADVLGANAMLSRQDGIDGGRYSAAMVFSPASSIYGGTDEIQRNIVAERTLGLPREQLPGKDMPYDEVLRSIGDYPR